MTTYSKSDLATQVLRDVGIIDAREEPDADDLAWVERIVSSVTRQLETEGVFIWNGSEEALPEEYLVQLSKRIGLDIGPSFGLFSIVDAELAKQASNETLRRMNAKQPTGSVAEAEFF